MPIYEYECCSCGLHFERKQRFDEESISQCPNCQGKSKRRLHSVAVIYKGSGFYTTDHRKSDVASEDIAKPKETPAPAKETKAEKTEKVTADKSKA